jgi:hypothetical protein
MAKCRAVEPVALETHTVERRRAKYRAANGLQYKRRRIKRRAVEPVAFQLCAAISPIA